ncbi:hypothetical protein C8F04DRAFT_1240760 [Mycena alexandri]|uniref:Uncharacterized protein n=1 Tax=Mycena alexandri TaxID=1745969 RepID=A0AAD6S8U3_9AGAR|nr:hypothetical protein C8F04DRAFT_1240760 [Mycena alexandri]
MVKGEGNERPKGPITSHAKTNAAPPLRPSSCPTSARPAQLLCLRFKPILFHLGSRGYRNPPPSWQLLPRRVPQRPSKRFPTRQRRQWLPRSTRFCLPQRILELVNPRANDEYCQQIHTSYIDSTQRRRTFSLFPAAQPPVIVHAATPRTSLARIQSAPTSAYAYPQGRKPPTLLRLRTSTTGAG